MDNTERRGILIRISAFFLIVGLGITGCIEPNPGLNFASKEAPEAGFPSAIQLAQGGEELDLRTAQSIRRYGHIIQKYAHAYQVDWRLILAVMRQESSFRPRVVSYKGAYGLMQIMPLTSAELTQKIGVKNTLTPYNNIKAGIYHLRSLHRYFDDAKGDERIKLTLAAYNAGLNRIRDAQDVARYMGDDPNSWAAVKDALPMLSKRYKTLHSRIWRSGTPGSGYFRDSRQTTRYVENIMSYYDGYQLALR